MHKSLSFISHSFRCYADSLRICNYFNFKKDAHSESFAFAYVFEIITYFCIWGVSIPFLNEFFAPWIVPILFILYYIPFYSFIARTLNCKYGNHKGLNMAVCLLTLLLSVLNILSFAVYFFYIHDNPMSPFGNHPIIVDCVILCIYIVTPMNFIIRAVLTLLCFYSPKQYNKLATKPRLSEYVKYGLKNYLNSQKLDQFFNFRKENETSEFVFAFPFYVIVYFCISIFSSILLFYFKFVYMILPLFILYYIPFYSFVSRTLNGKYITHKRLNIASNIVALVLTLVGVFLKIFQEYSLECSLYETTPVLLDFLNKSVYIIIPLNFFIRWILILFSFYESRDKKELIVSNN